MLAVAVATVDVEVGACSAGGVKVGKYSRVYANIKSVINKSMGFMIDWDEQKASVAEPHVGQSRIPRSHALTIWLMLTSECGLQPAAGVRETRTKVAGSCGLIDRRAYSIWSPYLWRGPPLSFPARAESWSATANSTKHIDGEVGNRRADYQTRTQAPIMSLLGRLWWQKVEWPSLRSHSGSCSCM